jgi:hypothetical protein
MIKIFTQRLCLMVRTININKYIFSFFPEKLKNLHFEIFENFVPKKVLAKNHYINSKNSLTYLNY